MNSIIVGGGCFWCLEAVFQQMKGITQVVSGYSGSDYKNPSYKMVCSGTTGHAEVIKLDYDESQISLAQILDVFFTMHDPTTLNRQGNDIGTQYRSIILYANQEEMDAAQSAVDRVKEIYDHPIVTEISALDIFYPAEAYHQNYYNNNPGQGYCNFVVGPKVNKFRAKFHDLIK